MCNLIKRLIVDHLHLVGDVFDRGPRADIIMDTLMNYHSVDIQWGNHDVLWMGAAVMALCIRAARAMSFSFRSPLSLVSLAAKQEQSTSR